MTRRRRDQAPRRHRLVPVWKKTLDREAFARALLLLAMHLDEKDRAAHKQPGTPGADRPGDERGRHDAAQ